MKLLIFPLFSLTMLFSVVFLKLSIGLPVRILLLASVFVLMVVFYKRYVMNFFNRHGIIVCLFLFMRRLAQL